MRAWRLRRRGEAKAACARAAQAEQDAPWLWECGEEGSRSFLLSSMHLNAGDPQVSVAAAPVHTAVCAPAPCVLFGGRLPGTRPPPSCWQEGASSP